MIRQLYPKYEELKPLKGAYLHCELHKQACQGQIYIYANYISSLDGRISLLNQGSGEYKVPKSIANPRDWRLYQELAGQSDVMITSARYFRQLAIGQAQDLLPVGVSPDFSDIKTWRAKQGLKPQPDVVVLSDSLDIPFAAVRSLSDRNIIVLTKAHTDLEKVRQLEDIGVQVIQSEEGVTGHFIRKTLERLSYRCAYMIAGPKVHQTLLKDGCIDELFLTSHFSLAGGKSFHTVLDDEIPATCMKLTALYLDEKGGQMFMRYRYG
ncbi:MAG: dihydrofolate reductase family protein [Ghiorsea sp.]